MFLIITRSFPPEIGGMQSLIGGLSESLLNHGPVKVFANDHPLSNDYDSKSLIDIERIKGIKLLRKYRKASLVNNFIKEKNNIRAIITDHWKSLELLDLQFLKKTKTFCLLHSKEINHKVGSTINKRLIKSTNKADFIIANSNFTKNLAETVGINKDKLHIIFPGIYAAKQLNSKYLSEADKIFSDSFPRIITVARMDKRKGHDKILMLIKNLKVKYPNIKYISVGFGDEEKNLINLSQELELEKNVIFLKDINEDLKLSLLNKSNLFLMPSRIEKNSVEGFGISFIEAASYGVGSIGGKDGGASDAIKHNETGLLCDGSDLNSISESVTEFFEDKKYIQYGANAKIFSDKFVWKKIVKNYLNLIN